MIIQLGIAVPLPGPFSAEVKGYPSEQSAAVNNVHGGVTPATRQKMRSVYGRGAAIWYANTYERSAASKACSARKRSATT